MISFFSRILDLIAPRACAVCGRRLAITEQVMCLVCNIGLPRTNYANHPYDNNMAKLFWIRIPIERAAALFFYEAKSEVSRIIYALKYGNHPEYGEEMGRMAAAEFAEKEFFKNIDFIVPIPITKARRRKRGYNQSEKIARGVSQITGIPILTNVVRRISFNESQTHKNRIMRAENVEQAFRLIAGSNLVGKHILLVDDVVTTGATVCACAEALQVKGKVQISVFSLGVVRPI